MWLGPLGLFGLLITFHGVRVGMERAAITESVVIDFYAARYLDDHRRELGADGALTDCAGVPGQTPSVWIEVRCSPRDGAPDFVYGADRSGKQLYAGRAKEDPQT
jgi:hypothetical protein